MVNLINLNHIILTKVMRLKIGDNFSLFNKNGEWEANILNISKFIVEFIVTKQLRQKENIKELWLAFSPIKSNYFNFMIQKATELGVTNFYRLFLIELLLEKSIKKDSKVIIESSEQSNRLVIPTIEDPKL